VQGFVNGGPVLGSIFTVLALLIAAIIVVLFLRKRKRRHRPHAKVAAGLLGDETATTTQFDMTIEDRAEFTTQLRETVTCQGSSGDDLEELL
jgi:hypothetical protein